MVFLAFKTLLYPLGAGKKTFLSTLNIMILQMVRNERLRFGGHVDIEVRYKILQLNVLKKTQILHNLSCFE
jgi:ABC-type phosphate transport system ATPase subunit